MQKPLTFVNGFCWQGQKDLNPRHSVLETDALPTELYPYVKYMLLSESKEVMPMRFKKEGGVNEKRLAVSDVVDRQGLEPRTDRL